MQVPTDTRRPERSETPGSTELRSPVSTPRKIDIIPVIVGIIHTSRHTDCPGQAFRTSWFSPEAYCKPIGKKSKSSLLKPSTRISYPADHTDFADYSSADVFRKGSYRYIPGKEFSYDAGLNLSYSVVGIHFYIIVKTTIRRFFAFIKPQHQAIGKFQGFIIIAQIQSARPEFL